MEPPEYQGKKNGRVPGTLEKERNKGRVRVPESTEQEHPPGDTVSQPSRRKLALLKR